MRLMVAVLAAGLLVAPGLARAQITCAQLPKAAEFVNTKLKPGPNTDAAKRHLEAAQHATSDTQCVAELRQVDYYAKRSMAADRKMASHEQPPPNPQQQPQPQAQAQAQAQPQPQPQQQPQPQAQSQAAAPAPTPTPTPTPAKPQSQIACAQLPKAADFVNTKLKPGPNTDAAKRHLEAAQHATSDAQCVAELRQVDYYAKRSMAADRRAATRAAAKVPGGQPAPAAPVRCGDLFHPTLPGGLDYRGPPVPGCPQIRL